MQIVDQTKDGELNFKEFVLFMNVLEHADQDDIPKILFLAADTDYSGDIDLAELNSILDKLNIQADDEDISDLVSDYGTRGRLSFPAYVGVMKLLVQ